MESIRDIEELMEEQMADVSSNEICFALVESLDNGVVKSVNLPMQELRAIICKWIEAGGRKALRRAKLDVIDEADEHWVTMPRSILKEFDELGVKLVAVHVRIFRIVMANRS